MKKEVVIIGYSCHAFVVCDIFISMGWQISGYCDIEKKKLNPYHLRYLGKESDAKVLSILKNTFSFIAIGDNKLRESIFGFLQKNKCTIANAVHPSAIISSQSKIGSGIMIAPNVVINSSSILEDGVICNTTSVIEHGCIINKFAHVAPGSVLCGNVKLGARTLLGANSVVKPGVEIGSDVIVGIGTTVIKNIKSGKTVAGNLQREL